MTLFSFKLFVDLVGDEIDQKILTFITYNLVRYMPLLFLVIIDVFQYTPQQKYPVCKFIMQITKD